MDNGIYFKDFLSAFHIHVKAISDDLCQKYKEEMKSPHPVAEIMIHKGRANLPKELQANWPAFVYGYFVGHNDAEDDDGMFMNAEEVEEWLKEESQSEEV